MRGEKSFYFGLNPVLVGRLRKSFPLHPHTPVCVCSVGVPGRKEDSTRKILKILSRAYALSEPPSHSATETTPAFVGGVRVCVIRPSRPLFGCVKVKYQQNLAVAVAAAAPLLQLQQQQQQQQHSCKSENLLFSHSQALSSVATLSLDTIASASVGVNSNLFFV